MMQTTSGDPVYGCATEDDVEVAWVTIRRLLDFLRDNFNEPFMRKAYTWGTLQSEGLRLLLLKSFPMMCSQRSTASSPCRLRCSRQRACRYPMWRGSSRPVSLPTYRSRSIRPRSTSQQVDKAFFMYQVFEFSCRILSRLLKTWRDAHTNNGRLTESRMAGRLHRFATMQPSITPCWCPTISSQKMYVGVKP